MGWIFLLVFEVGFWFSGVVGGFLEQGVDLGVAFFSCTRKSNASVRKVTFISGRFTVLFSKLCV